MQFRSQETRRMWAELFIGLSIDIAVAAVIAQAFDGTAWSVLFVFLGLQALYIALWLKRSVTMWSYYLLFGRRYAAKRVADFLRHHRFPEPESFVGSAAEYLQSVAENGKVSTTTRMQAAGEAGALNSLMALRMLQAAMMTSMAYEAGIERYKTSFPPRGASDSAEEDDEAA